MRACFDAVARRRFVAGLFAAALVPSWSVAGASSQPTIPESAILFVGFSWQPDEITVVVNDRRHDGTTQMTCNNLESEETSLGYQLVVLPPSDFFDVECELANGESFALSVPALERVGNSRWNFDRDPASEAAIEQCDASPAEQSVNAAQVWPSYLLIDLRCPVEIGEFSFDPSDQPVEAAITLQVCPAADDAICDLRFMS